MKQKQYSPQSVAEMGLVLFVANEGFLDDVDVTKVVAFETALLDYFNTEHAALRDEINESGNYNDDIAAKLKACVESFKSSRTY
jgi:F-type H+-transporting ATPase subunit alpha